jgi:hypothetical protein
MMDNKDNEIEKEVKPTDEVEEIKKDTDVDDEDFDSNEEHDEELDPKGTDLAASKVIDGNKFLHPLEQDNEDDSEDTNVFKDIYQFAKQMKQDTKKTVGHCKICTFKYRDQVENMLSKGVGRTEIREFIRSKGVKISLQAISGHYNKHFKGKEEGSDLINYASTVNKWNKVRSTDKQFLNKYIKTLDLEFTYLCSKNSGLNLSERRKNNDLIIRLSSHINDLKTEMRKMQKDDKPAEIVIKALNKIIEVKISSANSLEVRQVLEDIVHQLAKEVGDLADSGDE